MNDKPICPNCGNEMARAGGQWSGRQKYQNYRCNHCGKNWLNTKEPYATRQIKIKNNLKTP